ncbi:glycosyltransferase [Candidatus Omnitrophota bacterium]
MKKILFLHPALDRGGAEKLRLTLLRRMDKDRYDVKVLCIGEKGSVGEELESLGYKVDELRENAASKSLSVTRRLTRYLIKERPDILHCSLFNANFHGRIAGLFSRVPHMITEEHGEHKQYKGIKFLPYIIADFFLSRFNDFIVCCSDRLKEDITMKEKLPHHKVVAIENCLDPDLCKINIQREDIRKKHNISDEIVFITAGALKAGKGHDYFIEALSELKSAGYGFKCFFAGDGSLTKVLSKRCDELGLSEEIIFLGNVRNIGDYLNASDIFVLASLSEGLSMALIEAMFMGLASIVTNVGSNPDLVKTDFNGTIILPASKEGLKEAMIFYLNNRDLIKEFGKRSKSIIEERYSLIDRYIERYYELWDKCDNNKS